MYDSTATSEFVDERYLARHFGLSRRFWQSQRRNGTGPRFYAVGSRRLYDPQEVATWIREHGVGGDNADQ